MQNPVAYGFSNLTRFSGRDGRGRFWPYAALVLGLSFVTMMVAMPLAMAPMFAKMSAYAAAHPESSTVEAGPGHYSVTIDAGAPDVPEIDFTPFMAVVGGVALLAVALLSAAVSRRLHDRGIAGYWGLTPVVFLTTGLILMPRLMHDFTTSATPDMGLFGLLLLNNMVYLASLAGLILILALPGNPRPNRYGEPPAP